ncbi:MAG: DnaD domain protein [Halanaerobiales bacterium]|nr:DnaD domain protein [Halanaerobiales bacterium]
MNSYKQLKIYRTQELILDENGNHSTQINQSVMLTKEAIDAGLLKELPDSLLSVYLYILTHVGADFSLTITPEKIAEFVPRTPIDIELTLKMLDNRGYIQLIEITEDQNNYSIILARPPKISEKTESSTSNLSQISQPIESAPKQVSNRENEAISYILQQKVFSEEDLVRAISQMIPAQNLNYGFRQEVDYWFKTFEKEVVKELVRRTDEARQKDSELNCQAYMRKIANDWIAEQIFTIESLKESDKLYRETRALIEEFGIEHKKQMTRTHWKTIYNWINAESKDDFALSASVARFAIQEAIRRKSDGRPSLKYIEDNYIKPLKKLKAKSVEEAKKFTQRSGGITPSKNSKLKKNNQSDQSKWQLGKDYTRFREN